MYGRLIELRNRLGTARKRYCKESFTVHHSFGPGSGSKLVKFNKAVLWQPGQSVVSASGALTLHDCSKHDMERLALTSMSRSLSYRETCMFRWEYSI